MKHFFKYSFTFIMSFFIIFIVLGYGNIYSQTYTFHYANPYPNVCSIWYSPDNAIVYQGYDIYRMTNGSRQRVAMWYKDNSKVVTHIDTTYWQIDLTKDFIVKFKANFGNSDNGADGIAFVLQPKSLDAIGGGGGGIGYGKGYKYDNSNNYQAMDGIDKSFAIEFDTYNNRNTSPQYLDDIATDHISYVINGDPTNQNNIIGNAIQASGLNTNIEDSLWHQIKIAWNATTHTMTTWFDNYVTHRKQETLSNLVTTLGSSEVFWGFTSSTGGNYAINQILFQSMENSNSCGSVDLKIKQVNSVPVETAMPSYSYFSSASPIEVPIGSTIRLEAVTSSTPTSVELYTGNTLTTTLYSAPFYFDVSPTSIKKYTVIARFSNGTQAVDRISVWVN